MLTEQILIPLIPNLKRQAKRYTKHHEDLVQDTLLKAWVNKHRFTSDVIPLKLLFCIMKRISIDKSRKHQSEYGPLSKEQMLGSRKISLPTQLSVVSLNECSKLANIDLAVSNALGYSLEDIDNTAIKRSSMYKAIKNIHAMKEEYV